jgi:hypothetical protein
MASPMAVIPVSSGPPISSLHVDHLAAEVVDLLPRITELR